MTRYRKIETGTWRDRKFSELSRPKPNGQTLWMWLLTGPATTVFPGVVIARDAAIASELGWPLNPELTEPGSFRGAWSELESRGMARADWNVGLVVLPRALMDRLGNPRESAKPGSPNQLRSWAKSYSEIPDCPLKDWYLDELKLFAKALDTTSRDKTKDKVYQAAYSEAFSAAIDRRRVADEYPNGYPNASATSTPTGRRPARVSVPVPVPVSPDQVGLSLRSSPDSGSGSPAFSAPDSRPTERSSAAPSAPEPDTGTQALRVPPATPPEEPPGTGLVASGDATEPAPRARGSGTVPPPVLPPGAVVPDPEYALRQAAVMRVWDRLNAIRADMALEFAWRDVRPLHLMDPGVGELNARLRELGASGEEAAIHVLACAAAEAKSSVPPTVRWLAGSLFGAAQWRRYSAMRVADAALPPRSTKHGAPAPERAAAAAALARERQTAADREAREKRIADEESKTDAPLTDEDRLALRELAASVVKNPDAAANGERSRHRRNTEDET